MVTGAVWNRANRSAAPSAVTALASEGAEDVGGFDPQQRRGAKVVIAAGQGGLAATFLDQPCQRDRSIHHQAGRAGIRRVPVPALAQEIARGRQAGVQTDVRARAKTSVSARVHSASSRIRRKRHADPLLPMEA